MNNGDFFTMSGTSQAAAAVSGVAALVLYNNPGLTPDQVKCRIIASGKPAVNADGTLAYSVLQQGTGLVDAEAAREWHGQQLRQPGPQHHRRSQRLAALHGPRAQQADGTFTVSRAPMARCWDQGYSSGRTASSGTNGYTLGQRHLWANGTSGPAATCGPAQTYGHSVGGRISVDHRQHGRPLRAPMSINSWVAPGIVSQDSIIREQERVAGPVCPPRFISGVTRGTSSAVTVTSTDSTIVFPEASTPSTSIV